VDSRRVGVDRVDGSVVERRSSSLRTVSPAQTRPAWLDGRRPTVDGSWLPKSWSAGVVGWVPSASVRGPSMAQTISLRVIVCAGLASWRPLAGPRRILTNPARRSSATIVGR